MKSKRPFFSKGIRVITFLFFVVFSLSGVKTMNAQITNITDVPIDATPFESYVGTYNYVTTGGTLRTSSNGVDPCAVDNTDSQTLSGIPAGATITKAYLYWSGSGQAADLDVTFQGQAITASRSYAANYDFDVNLGDFDPARTFYYFNGIADVTSMVATTGNGTYTFEDLTVDVGAGSNDEWYCMGGAVLSGWALLVVYNDVTLANKIVNIYEGFDVNRNDQTTFTLNDLDVTPGGEGSVAGIIWEGDETLGGTGANPEEFRFNGFSLTDALNDPDEAYNGSVTATNSRTEYGVDIDVFDVSPYIKGGDTSATLEVESAQDLIISNAFVVAIDNFLPELSITKTTFPEGEVAPGSTLKYTIEIENTGILAVDSIAVNDVLPSGVTYVPGTAMKTYQEATGVETTANYNDATSTLITNNSCDTPYEILFNVTDSFIIDDLNIGYKMSHTRKGEINLWIENPSGIRLKLLDYNNDPSDNWSVLFNSESATGNAALYATHDTSSTYYIEGQPFASLAVFNGTQAQGVWKLIICDDDAGGEGTYLESSLQFTYTPSTTITSSANPPLAMVLDTDNITLRSTEKLIVTFDVTVDADTYDATLTNTATANSIDLLSPVSDTAENTTISNPCTDGASTDGSPTATDKDGDGVNNACDVDDDNDGIVDANEDICIGIVDATTLGAGSGDPQVFNATNGATVTIENLTDAAVFNDAGVGYRFGSDVATTDRDYRITFSTAISGVEIDLAYINNNIDGEEQLRNFAVNGGGTISIAHTDTTTDVGVITTFDNGVFASSLYGGSANTSGKLKITSTAPFTEITLTFDFIDFNPELGINVDNPFGIMLENICILNDTDNDGLIDSLDTDSDGDGCPDAFEGAGNIIEGLSTLSGGSNNGSSDNLGTSSDADGNPLVSGSGYEQATASAVTDSADSVACTVDLSLVKTVNNALPKVGTTIIYTIVVTNSGPLNATGVQVTDAIPSELTYLSGGTGTSIPVGTTFDGSLWGIGNLNVGDSIELKVEATVNQVGVIVNTAQVSSATQNDVDSTPGNDN